MNWLDNINYGDLIDITCAALVLFLLIRGAVKGISGELAHIIATVVIFTAAIYGYRPIANLLNQRGSVSTNPLMMHLMIILAFLLVGALVAWGLRAVLRHSIRVIVTPAKDWALGMLCGLVGAGILVLVLFLVGSLIPTRTVQTVIREESRVGQLVSPMVLPIANRLTKLPHYASATNRLTSFSEKVEQNTRKEGGPPPADKETPEAQHP